MTKSSPTPAILIAVLVIGLLLTAYVGGYYWLTADVVIYALPGPPPSPNGKIRYFNHEWQVTVFQPAAWIESAVCGEEVSLNGIIQQGGTFTIDTSNADFTNP